MSRIALIGENSCEYIQKLIDIWNHGDSAVLIDWRIPFFTAVEMMREADVHTCYIEKKLFKETCAGISRDITFFFYNNTTHSAKYLHESVYEKFKPNYSKNEAIIIYSSGTTGKSKGIILSHYAINTNADAIIAYMRLTKEDCLYIARPLSHSSAITGELLVALKMNASLVISPIVVPPRIILNNIINFNVTICCLNPAMLGLIADEMERKKYSFPALKAVYVSGSILTDKIYSKAHEIFGYIPIYNVYGLSEAGPRVTAQRSDCCKSNSVGKPINGVEVVILDEKGNDLPKGCCGTVYVNTPCVFSGYVSGKCKFSLRTGWLNTGDIGYWDENKELHIVGRADDMLIVDTHKIFPSQVEEKILQCSEVIECIVTLVKYNETDFLACLYTGIPGAEKRIRESLTEKMPVYEIPRRYVHCQTLPRNRNEKISVKEVKTIIEREMRKTI